jgi:hypothetical protein
MLKARHMVEGLVAQGGKSIRGSTMGDILPVILAVVAACVIYGGRHMQPGSDLKLLTFILPPTILALHFSNSRQDEKINDLYRRSGEGNTAKHMHTSQERFVVPHPVHTMNAEKMTATRDGGARAGVHVHENVRGNLNGHIGRDAVARDMQMTTDRIEQHTHTHPGVRNSNGYAPTRLGEAELIQGKSHMEDNASFYAHSSTDRSQERTNMPTGHVYNRVQSADAPGAMQLSLATDNGQRVQMDYTNPSANGAGRVAPPPPTPQPPKVDALARLFMDTAVTGDKSETEVEGMKEGRN